VHGARVELLPGVGHTPMLEDPHTTGKLLPDFAAAAEHPTESATIAVLRILAEHRV
jgi:hypothetical protein